MTRRSSVVEQPSHLISRSQAAPVPVKVEHLIEEMGFDLGDVREAAAVAHEEMFEIAVLGPVRERLVTPCRPEARPWANALTAEAAMMHAKTALGGHVVMLRDLCLQRSDQVRALVRSRDFLLDVLVVAAVLCVAAGRAVVETVPGQHQLNPHSMEGSLVSSPARLVRRYLKICESKSPRL
jgi:hypothetical protein